MDAKDKKDSDDEEESKFMPRLGGPREKLDPRFAKKRRPVKKGKNDKEDLEDRQNEQPGQSRRQSERLEERAVAYVGSASVVRIGCREAQTTVLAD